MSCGEGIRLFTTEVEAHDYLLKRRLYLLLMLGTIQKRERFLHSGANKVLPNEENAPELSVTAREELFHYLNKSHTLKVVRR